MPFIRQIRSTANGTEKALQLAGTEIFFPMSIGNNWGKLRIGLRCCAQAISGSQEAFQLTNLNYNHARFGVALCNGSSGYFSGNTTGAIGIYGGGGSSDEKDMSRTAIPYRINLAKGYTYFQKVGTDTRTVYRSNSTGVITCRSYAYAAVYWTAYYFDFDRVTTPGSVIYTMIGRTEAQTTVAPNTSYAVFQDGLNQTITPTNFTNLSSTAQTTASVWTENYYDTLSIFSNMTANIIMEISHVGVARQL